MGLMAMHSDKRVEPALAGLAADQREAAIGRFAVIKPHVEDGVPLARAAGDAKWSANGCSALPVHPHGCGERPIDQRPAMS